MSNIWITSDSHFSHTNIAGKAISSWNTGYRDFDSIEDMNNSIVDSFNKVAKKDDVIYHLGDWSFGGKDKVKEFMDRLVCKNVVLIYGNHDHNIRKYYNSLFMETHDLLNRKIAGRNFVLCHYSMQVWEASHRGTLHCFGHSHHTINGVGRSMDVGWCGFRRPLNIEEVIDTLDSKKISFVDHHTASTNP